MLDLGWTELLVIGIVALIVVGPKDLPKMFRTLGQFTAKARAMAREFQRAMDDAADSTGVKDVARDLRKATDLKGAGMDELKSWDPMREDKSARNARDTDPDDEEALDRAAAEMDTMREAHKAAKAKEPPASETGAKAPASAARGRTSAAEKAGSPPKATAKSPAAAKAKSPAGASASAKAKAPAKPKAPAKRKTSAKTKAPASDTAADKGSS